MDGSSGDSESGHSEVEEDPSESGEPSVVEELCDPTERLRISDESAEGSDGLLLSSNASSEVETHTSDASENEDSRERIEERTDGQWLSRHP